MGGLGVRKTFKIIKKKEIDNKKYLMKRKQKERLKGELLNK